MLNPTLPWLELLPEMLLRLGSATVIGLLLGLDRELKGSEAGLRTHGLIALSSSLLTVSSLLLFYELRSERAQPDPLRVVEGLATAFGLIAAGLVFVRDGQVRNLTTAAHVWLTITIGIACGAGQYSLVTIAALLGLLMLTGLRFVERRWLENKDG